MFFYKRHILIDNESEWDRWWEGTCVLSHGTNYSSGVAILFSQNINVNILVVEEVVKGRVLLMHMEFEGTVFVLINVYALNSGPERFCETYVKNAVQKIGNNVCVIIGGDWNCTIDFIIDRNGEEPHNELSVV